MWTTGFVSLLPARSQSVFYPPERMITQQNKNLLPQQPTDSRGDASFASAWRTPFSSIIDRLVTSIFFYFTGERGEKQTTMCRCRVRRVGNLFCCERRRMDAIWWWISLHICSTSQTKSTVRAVLPRKNDDTWACSLHHDLWLVEQWGLYFLTSFLFVV